MEGNSTKLSIEGANDRNYAFDYSFWSFDNYSVDPSGYYSALPGKNYADQALLYNEIGEEIVQNSILGFHCSLFAYGQTGSGKSFSMIGF